MDTSAPSFTLAQLAQAYALELNAQDAATVIHGVNTLARASAGELAFFTNPRYTQQLTQTRAGVVITTPEHAAACPVPVLTCDQPYAAYAKIAAHFARRPAVNPGIHPSAVIAPSAHISPSASIGPLCTVGANSIIGDGVVLGSHTIIGDRCRIGAQSRLSARVTLCDDVVLGQRVLIHPGAVLGADGFGLAVDGERWIKVPQLGTVRVGDDCEIGANTAIDRGALDDTVLEEDVHLDNLIQIAHNVHIGAHTAMAGCSAVAGSARIGKWCMIGGNVGILGHLEIADHVIITAKSLVTNSIRQAGQYSSGTPLQKSSNWRKNAARFKQLDKLARYMKTLQREKND